MGEPIWPKKRPDGTVLVAARFKVSVPRGYESVSDAVSQWVAGKATAGADISRDLIGSPQTIIVDDNTIDVVFNGRADSRIWRDWLVDFTREVLASLHDARLDGFYDQVSGVFRPGYESGPSGEHDGGD